MTIGLVSRASTENKLQIMMIMWSLMEWMIVQLMATLKN